MSKELTQNEPKRELTAADYWASIPENMQVYIVKTGDISRINENQQYAYMCYRALKMGIEISALPFDILPEGKEFDINGNSNRGSKWFREKLYLNLRGLSQMAAISNYGIKLISEDFFTINCPISENENSEWKDVKFLKVVYECTRPDGTPVHGTRTDQFTHICKDEWVKGNKTGRQIITHIPAKDYPFEIQKTHTHARNKALSNAMGGAVAYSDDEIKFISEKNGVSKKSVNIQGTAIVIEKPAEDPAIKARKVALFNGIKEYATSTGKSAEWRSDFMAKLAQYKNDVDMQEYLFSQEIEQNGGEVAPLVETEDVTENDLPDFSQTN